MVDGPHPDSVLRYGESGRQVQLKVHQCVWSGNYIPNSLAAIQDCYRARVARAEIDIAMLADEDFLVVHDLDLANATSSRGRVEDTTRAQAERLHLIRDGLASLERPPLLSEVADAIAREPYPTLLELDLKDWKPWPWPRVEELARLLHAHGLHHHRTPGLGARTAAPRPPTGGPRCVRLSGLLHAQ